MTLCLSYDVGLILNIIAHNCNIIIDKYEYISVKLSFIKAMNALNLGKGDMNKLISLHLISRCYLRINTSMS